MLAMFKRPDTSIWFALASLSAAGACFGVANSLVVAELNSLGFLNLALATVHFHIWALAKVDKSKEKRCG